MGEKKNLEEIDSYCGSRIVKLFHKTVPSPEPWIVAHDYNPETETWGWGSYFEKEEDAKNHFENFVYWLGFEMHGSPIYQDKAGNLYMVRGSESRGYKHKVHKWSIKTKRMRACGSGFTWFDSVFEAKQELVRIGEEKGWKRVIIRRRYYGDFAKETMPFIDGSVIYTYEENVIRCARCGSDLIYKNTKRSGQLRDADGIFYCICEDCRKKELEEFQADFDDQKEEETS